MEEMFANIMISLFNLILSVGMLMFTFIQINKQTDESLFEKRLASYKKIIAILNLWKKHRKHFIDSDKEKIFGANNILFSFLTNTSYLYKICNVINQEQRNDAIHQEFLEKLEDIEFESNILEFIYSKERIKHVICFVICYKELLMSMYQYQIVLSNIEKGVKDLRENGNPYNRDLFKENNELMFRKNIFKNIDKLDEAYKKIVGNREIEYMKNTLRFIKNSNTEV